MVVLNLSVLTSVRRIVKIAVRFLHTKTALCDRKDTQSRFAVNAARSIVCVETDKTRSPVRAHGVSMPHAALCVSRRRYCQPARKQPLFQCRTQHCVCRDFQKKKKENPVFCFNAARSIVCVETLLDPTLVFRLKVSMPHAALCVSRLNEPMVCRDFAEFQCRTQHCVCRD